MVGLLLFCLMYILYIHNELRKVADVGSQVGERRFCSRVIGVSDRRRLKLARGLTDGHCRHAQHLKGRKTSTFHVLLGSREWGKAQKAPRVLKEKVEVSFSIYSFLEVCFFSDTQLRCNYWFQEC